MAAGGVAERLLVRHQRIVAPVEQLGKQSELLARLYRQHYKLTPILLGDVL